jgi:poly(3-hydroxybutyrate) depolymerase
MGGAKVEVRGTIAIEQEDSGIKAMPIEACRIALRRLGVFTAPFAALAFVVAGARADDMVKLTHQGVERTAILHQAAAATGPRPLVIALQGLGQSMDGLRETLKLDPIADREGFSALYPDAIERKWSYGRPIINRCRPLAARRSTTPPSCVC